VSIFEKKQAGIDDADTDDGAMRLVRCAGSYAGAIVGRKLRVKFSMGPGAPVGMRTFELPRGRIVDFSVYPTVALVMANGDVLQLSDGKWRKCFNVLNEEHES
jgi:hypothetical protein